MAELVFIFPDLPPIRANFVSHPWFRATRRPAVPPARPQCAIVDGYIHDIEHRPRVFFAKRATVEQLNKVVQYISRNDDCTHLRVAHCRRVTDLPLASASSALHGDGDGSGSMASGDIDGKKLLAVPTSDADDALSGAVAALPPPPPPVEMMTADEAARIEADEEAIVASLHAHIATLSAIYPRIKFDLIDVRGEFCPEVVRALSSELATPCYMMCIGCPRSGFKHPIERYGGVRIITF